MKKDFREKCAQLEYTDERRSNAKLSRTLITAFTALLGVGTPSLARGQVNGIGSSLVIRVENYSSATPATLIRAEREASQILQKTGLQTEWVNCAMEYLAENRSERCRRSSGSDGIELRIVLQTQRKYSWDSEFGYAVVPSFASVYYERVKGVASYDNAAFEAPILLGCVMAHEIGHLLLGPNSHYQSGIMLARWERQQIRQAITGRLSFTEEEAHHIQREVAIRTSQQASHLAMDQFP
jgi:hypothetical protein